MLDCIWRNWSIKQQRVLSTKKWVTTDDISFYQRVFCKFSTSSARLRFLRFIRSTSQKLYKNVEYLKHIESCETILSNVDIVKPSEMGEDSHEKIT